MINYFLIYSFLVFLILGNLPRFLPLPTIFGSANVGELYIYIIASIHFIFYLLKQRKFHIAYFPTVLAGFTLLSLLIGIAKWGLDSVAILYNLRFVFQLLSSVSIGYAFFYVYETKAEAVSNLFSNVYIIISLLAIGLLLAFPESTVLWAALSDVGVDFQGDPHVGRLVSLYFDPNFFGTIIPIAVILSFATPSGIITLICRVGLFFACLALTSSRSGISTMAIIGVMYLFFLFFRARKTRKIQKRVLVFIFFLVALSITVALVFNEYLFDIYERFSGVSTDPSAGARLESFNIGNDLLSQQPILGFGYNYSLSFVTRFRTVGLDSGIQALMVNYGLIIFFLMIFLFIYWSLNLRARVRESGNRHLINLCSGMFVYFFVSLIWAGNFNQIFFFPFWIMPISTLFSYIEFSAKYNPARSRPSKG